METSSTNYFDSSISGMCFSSGDKWHGDRMAMYKCILKHMDDDTLLTLKSEFDLIMEMRVQVCNELNDRSMQVKQTGNGTG